MALLRFPHMCHLLRLKKFIPFSVSVSTASDIAKSVPSGLHFGIVVARLVMCPWVPSLRHGSDWHHRINLPVVLKICISRLSPLMLAPCWIMSSTITISHSTCMPVMVSVIVDPTKFLAVGVGHFDLSHSEDLASQHLVSAAGRRMPSLGTVGLVLGL